MILLFVFCFFLDHKSICYGCILELYLWGKSNEYLQYVFMKKYQYIWLEKKKLFLLDIDLYSFHEWIRKMSV